MRVPEFSECPYCGQELEQWSIRFQRSDRPGDESWQPLTLPRVLSRAEGRPGVDVQALTDLAHGVREGEGLTLLSLCPSTRCGYYVLRYRDGLTHWDRDPEAARLLRTLFGDE